MAPELKSRRGAAAAGGASKKLKSNHPLAPKFEVIEKALKQTTDLPDSVRSIFVHILPYSLGEPHDMRHCFQNEIISTIGKTLDTSAQALESEIAKAQERLEETSAKESQQKDDCAKQTEELEEKDREVQRCKQELATVALAFRAAKKTFQEAKDTQQCKDAELEAMSTKKQNLEGAVVDLISPLSAGSTEGQDVKLMIDNLVKLLNDFEFEESLITALKPALHKAPAERGDFDVMCFKELTDDISRRVADFETELSSGEAGKNERAAAVADAEESFNKARIAQNQSSRLFAAATTAYEESNAATDVAKKALKDLGVQMKSCNHSLAKAKQKLETFKDGPLAAFKELVGHDNTAKEQMIVDESMVA